MQEIINEEVDSMLKDGIIQKSKSPWSSPIVIVRKKDGKPRFCVDFRKLNSVSKKDAYPLLHINAILDRLRSATYLSSIDLKSGYWQVALDRESQKLTAFTVPDRGLFEFKVMPFGLHTAPATFQRLIDKVITPDLAPNIFAYLDDIIIISSTFEQHLKLLKIVFEKLKAAKLRPNKDKCKFARRSLKYLGHIVNERGVHTDPDKVIAVQRIASPKNPKELKRFLGMISWYRRFIPNVEDTAAPLQKLLKKNSGWKWENEQQVAFDALKNCLTKAPILACPDWAEPFVLQTDASLQGLGAVLTQNDGDKEHVIAYASRSLNKAEKNYSITELECLAVKWAMWKMIDYLEGYKFTVITDHQALKWLNSIDNPSGRLAGCVLEISQFDFNIEYRKSTDNNIADALSKNPIDIYI